MRKIVMVGVFVLFSSFGTLLAQEDYSHIPLDIEDEEILRVGGEVWFSGLDAIISVTKGAATGTKIDLQKTLDMNTSRAIPCFRVSSMAKFGVSLSYWNEVYSKRRTLDTAIVFQGINYSIGDVVDSRLSIDALDSEFSLDLYPGNRIDLRILFGFSYYGYKGSIYDVTTSQVGSRSMSILLPYLGIGAKFSINEYFSVGAKISGMSFDLTKEDLYLNSFLNTSIFISFSLEKNVEFSLGYHYVDLDIEKKGTDDAYSVEKSLDGIFAAIEISF